MSRLKNPSPWPSTHLWGEGRLATLLTAFVLACQPHAPPELRPGQSVVRPLEPGESHAYRLTHDAGQPLGLRVDQRCMDVSAVVVDGAGDEVGRIHRRGTGKETLRLDGTFPGPYRLEVRSAPDSPPGPYRLSLHSLPDATSPDAVAEAGTGASPTAQEGALRLAVEARRAPGQELELIAALRRLGRHLARRDERRQALQAYDEAMDLARRLGAIEPLPALLNDAGASHWALGEVDLAWRRYGEALEIAPRVGNRQAETTALNNLALVLAGWGEIEEALILYDQALAGWRELGRRSGEAATLHNMGTALTVLERDLEATEVLTAARRLQAARGDCRGEAAALTALAWVELLGDDAATALRHYRQALTLQRLAEHRYGQASTLDRMASALVRLERFDEAQSAYERALALFRDVEDVASQGHTLSNLGSLLAKQGRTDEARRHQRAARELLRQVREPTAEAMVLVELARLEHGLGRLEEARAWIEPALELLDAVGVSPRSPELRSAFFSTFHAPYELSVDLLLELHRRKPKAGYGVLALEARERGRARGLLATLAQAGVDLGHDVDPVLLNRERKIHRQIRAKVLRHLELRAQPPSPELPALERELRALALEDVKLQARLRAQSAPRGAFPEARPLTPHEVRTQVLDSDTLLLTFGLGETRAFVALTEPAPAHEAAMAAMAAMAAKTAPTAKASFVQELSHRQEIETAARELHRALSRGRRSQARRTAQRAAARLAQLLLEPVEERLAAAARGIERPRLLITSDGALQYVPFAALPLPSTGEPLLTEYEIVTVPSASVLPLLRQGRRSRPTKTLAVLAVPGPLDENRPDAPSPGPPDLWPAPAGSSQGCHQGLHLLPPLPHVRREAEALAASLPAREVLLAVGPEANRSLVTGGELAHYRVVHFATHGCIDETRPELSGLVLGGVDELGRPTPDFLDLGEVYRLELNADLVVLSACRTALGKEVRGEGLLSFSRGFFHAGAARVLVSLWDVADRATAELMTRFYHALLQEGLGPAAALRQAQLSLRQEPAWRSPFYWAGFSLQGDWQ